MITEIVLWKMPEEISREEILTKFRAFCFPTSQANPNLVHKAFLFDESSRRGGGVYLSKNIDAAKRAHGRGTPRPHKVCVWGDCKKFQYFDAPVVIDNASRQDHR